MNLEELEQIAESVRLENAKFDHEINVCMGTGCLSQHSDKLKDALNKAVAAFREKCVRAPHRLHGPVRGRAAGARRSRRDPLSARAKPTHAEAVVASSRRRTGCSAAMRPARALRSAGPRGARELRPHRSGKDRRLHRPRWLSGPGQGSDRDGAQRRDQADHRERACAAAAAAAIPPA